MTSVNLDICMELDLAGEPDDFENEVMLACDQRGTYGATAGVPYVVVGHEDIEEVSLRLSEIAGLRITKVYVEHLEVDTEADDLIEKYPLMSDIDMKNVGEKPKDDGFVGALGELKE